MRVTEDEPLEHEEENSCTVAIVHLLLILCTSSKDYQRKFCMLSFLVPLLALIWSTMIFLVTQSLIHPPSQSASHMSLHVDSSMHPWTCEGRQELEVVRERRRQE